MISAIVSDTSGVADLTGGTLIDQPSGATYGAFSTPGGQGTFLYELDWQQIYQAQAISFAPGGSEKRVVTGKFFDNQARSTEGNVTLTLQCDDATSSPCSKACADLTNDIDNCGACGASCTSAKVYVDGNGGACIAGHCTSVDATSAYGGHIVGASCNAACASIGATCVTNTCTLLPTGAIVADGAGISCASTSAPSACCCQQ
jgi:hypothetical protein